MSRASAPRMPPGTAVSTRSASELRPTTSSIAATSSSRGPMWRAAKAGRSVVGVLTVAPGGQTAVDVSPSVT